MSSEILDSIDPSSCDFAPIVTGNTNQPLLPVEPNEECIESEKLLELASSLFAHIEEQLGRADTKAELTLTADALLVATVTSLGKGVVYKIFDGQTSILENVIGVMVIIMFIALVISIYFACLAIMPRLAPPIQKIARFFYFGSICQMGETEFIDGFTRQQRSSVLKAILSENYAIAQIAHHKFFHVARSHKWLIFSLVCWAIVQFLLAFSR